MNVPPNININLLENHGFMLTSFIGKGTMGEVYQGICSERAVGLIRVNILETDPYNLTILFIGDKAYETYSIEGRQIAVKVIELNKNPDPSAQFVSWGAQSNTNNPSHSSLPGIQSLWNAELPLNSRLTSQNPEWTAELHLENPSINFPEEANILLGLNHRNIVKLYDVVIDYGNYTIYIVMERMEKSLNTYIEDLKPLTVEKCNDCIIQLINGLDYLHSNNIYHNDIHSGNIMVNQTQEEVIIKYVDFGLATDTVRGGFQNIFVNYTTTRDLSHLGGVLVLLVNSTDFSDYLDYENTLKHVFNDLIDSKHSNAHAVNILLQDLIQKFRTETFRRGKKRKFEEI